MANIDRIVRVNIALNTAALAQVEFNQLMLFGVFTKPAGSTAVVYIITDPDELVESYGVLTTSKLYNAAVVAFSQIPRPRQIYIGFDAGLPDPTNALIAIYDENHDWYAIADSAHTEARAVQIATYVESKEKIFVTVLSATNNSSAASTDTTSTGHLLMVGNYFRTAWWYDPNPDHFPDVAACIKAFSRYPGQETWANQRLSNVTSVKLSETLARNIFDKNGNTFEPFRNIAITQNGRTAGGEWIDVIRFRDWLCEEIKVRVFTQLVDNRIPYTDTGIGIIRTRLQQALDFGVDRGGIAPPEVNAEGDLIPSYTIQVPLSMEISTVDKANRILRDVYFTARLAGAIHVVEIYGTLTYESLPVAQVVSVA